MCMVVIVAVVAIQIKLMVVYEGCVFIASIIFKVATSSILYYDQPIYNYLTNYHTPATCFDTIVSSSGSS